MANTKPGERKLQILQALAAMLEQPRGDRITTAALAARLDVSEAALYRHFASKAQMFEGLIEFIETSVFGLINKISDTEENGVRQVRSIAASQGDLPENEASARAAMAMAFVMGRWHRYAKGGFQLRPTEGAAQQLVMLAP
jgi:TetR/AcrR family transcriptional regulator